MAGAAARPGGQHRPHHANNGRNSDHRAGAMGTKFSPQYDVTALATPAPALAGIPTDQRLSEMSTADRAGWPEYVQVDADLAKLFKAENSAIDEIIVNCLSPEEPDDARYHIYHASVGGDVPDTLTEAHHRCLWETSN